MSNSGYSYENEEALVNELNDLLELTPAEVEIVKPSTPDNSDWEPPKEVPKSAMEQLLNGLEFAKRNPQCVGMIHDEDNGSYCMLGYLYYGNGVSYGDSGFSEAIDALNKVSKTLTGQEIWQLNDTQPWFKKLQSPDGEELNLPARIFSIAIEDMS